MHLHTCSRVAFVRNAGLAAAAAIGTQWIAPCAADEAVSPEKALKRLMAGNKKFVAGSLPAQTAIAERRAEVSKKQKPFAMVLSCADSRVPVEHVFNQLIGDLFICRVAGNIADAATVGSFEYAVANFHPAVLVVLAHQRCGAVDSTISLSQSGKTAPGSIQSIVDAIAPAVEKTPKGSLSGYDYVDAVAKTNAVMVAKSLAGSEILTGAISAGKLRLVPAFYSLESGVVTLLH